MSGEDRGIGGRPVSRRRNLGKRVPLRVLEIERVTGVTRTRLRPDQYPSDDRSPPTDGQTTPRLSDGPHRTVARPPRKLFVSGGGKRVIRSEPGRHRTADARRALARPPCAAC